MLILTPDYWQDYILLDSGDGKRLEKFGQYTLVRPDPQCIWRPLLHQSEWQKADAVFDNGWKKHKDMPDKWLLTWKDLKFWVKLSPFKHTGVFPEQAVHWEFISSVIASETSQSILNLFGYTGISSLIAAEAGAKVTHVDASYPTIGWAKENQLASGLENKPIRWILDDCLKFCQRELKRGAKYDGIIMDPPIYGHDPKGKVWKFEESFPSLVEVAGKLLSDKPLFFIVNAYAISASGIMLENVLKDYLKDFGGEIESGELALEEQNSNRLLSTGIFARWKKDA